MTAEHRLRHKERYLDALERLGVEPESRIKAEGAVDYFLQSQPPPKLGMDPSEYFAAVADASESGAFFTSSRLEDLSYLGEGADHEET